MWTSTQWTAAVRLSTDQPMDQTLNPLRILVVDGHAERRREVAGAIASLGHQVILEEDPARVAAATATERPDVAIVVVEEGNSEALAGIGTIVHEAACPVIAILDVEDPLFIREAAKRGIFAHITSVEDPRELESSIDIVLRRFAEYHNLEGAFSRRAVTERAKGILMERHGIDEREAFEMLRTEARHSNRKLVDIAEAVLTSHRLLPRSAEAEVPADARDHPSAS
jgi:AmiR/NasT family two-component response regulator